MASILDDIRDGGFLNRAEDAADFAGIPSGGNPVMGTPPEILQDEQSFFGSLGDIALGGLNLVDTGLDALGRASRTFIGTGDIEQSFDAISDKSQALYGKDLKELWGIGDFGEEDNSGFSPLANPEEFLRDTLDFAVDVGIEIATDPLTYLGVGLLSKGIKGGEKATSAARQIISDIGRGAITRREGNIKYLSEFGKDLGLMRSAGGKYPGLEKTFAGRVKAGEQSLFSLNVPFTDINVPIFQQASIGLAEKGSVAAKWADDFLGLTPMGRAVGRGISKFKNIFVADDINNAQGELARISGNKGNNLLREYSNDIHAIDDIMNTAKLTPDERNLVRLHTENFDDIYLVEQGAKPGAESFIAKEAREKTKAIQEKINELPSEKQEAIYLASRKASEAGNRLFADASGAGIQLDELGAKISKKLEDAKDFVDDLEGQHLERLQKSLKEREGQFLHDQTKREEVASKLFHMDKAIKTKREEFRITKDPALRQEIAELSTEYSATRQAMKAENPVLRERQAERLAAIQILNEKIGNLTGTRSGPIKFMADVSVSPSSGELSHLVWHDGKYMLKPVKAGGEIVEVKFLEDVNKMSQQQQWVKGIGENLGVDVKFIADGQGVNMRGGYKYNKALNQHTIFLQDKLTSRDLAHTFGHEMMHFGIKSLDDTAKKSLIATGYDILGKDIDNSLDSIIKQYNSVGRKLTPDQAIEELIVDAGGKLMADDGLEWISKAAAINPGIIPMFTDFIKRGIEAFRKFISRVPDKEAAELGKVADDLQKIVFGLSSPIDEIREQALKQLQESGGLSILTKGFKGDKVSRNLELLHKAGAARITRKRQALALKETTEADRLAKAREAVKRFDDRMANQDPTQLSAKIAMDEEIVISEAHLKTAENQFQEPEKLLEARKKLQDLQAKKARTPNWMPAILTENALDRIHELGIARGSNLDKGTLRAAFERTFTEKGGIPLDIEDINKLEKKGLKRLGKIPLEGEISLFDAIEYIRSKDRKSAKKAAQKLGQLVKVDPAEILEISSRNTARAIGKAEYANGLKRVWGFDITEDGAGKLTKGFVDASNLHPNLKGVALPIEIAKAAAKHYEAASRITDIAGGMMGPIQDFTRMWKMFQTQLFPGFHLRNKIANLFRRAQEGGLNSGLANRQPLTTLYFRMMKNGEKDASKFKDLVFDLGPHGKMRGDELVGLAYKEGVIGTGFMAAEIGANSVAQLRGGFFNSVSSAFTKHTKIARLSELVEESDRLEHFLARLIKGDSKAQAAYSVEKALFNYRRVSKAVDFARHSGLLPFAAWSAKNLPAQFEVLFRRPGQFAAMVHAKSAIENGVPGIPEDRLPVWLRDKYNIRTRKNADGTWDIITLTGIVPMADLPELTNLPMFFNQLLGPIPKEAAQQLFNTNLFTKKTIKEFDGQFDVINIPPFDIMEVDPRAASAFRTLAGRPVSLAERVTRELKKLGSDEEDKGELFASIFGGGGITSALTGIPLDTRKVGKLNKFSLIDLKKSIALAKRQLAKVQKERPDEIDKQLALKRALQKLEQRKRAAEIP